MVVVTKPTEIGQTPLLESGSISVGMMTDGAFNENEQVKLSCYSNSSSVEFAA